MRSHIAFKAETILTSACVNTWVPLRLLLNTTGAAKRIAGTLSPSPPLTTLGCTNFSEYVSTINGSKIVLSADCHLIARSLSLWASAMLTAWSKRSASLFNFLPKNCLIRFVRANIQTVPTIKRAPDAANPASAPTAKTKPKSTPISANRVAADNNSRPAHVEASNIKPFAIPYAMAKKGGTMSHMPNAKSKAGVLPSKTGTMKSAIQIANTMTHDAPTS